MPGAGAVYRSQTLNFHAPVKIGDVVSVIVEVIELVPEGRKVRLHCEALVDNMLVLDGEAIVSVPARPKSGRGAAIGTAWPLDLRRRRADTVRPAAK